MQTYDKKKIGRLIATGGEHLVYEYGTDKVIKFSLLFYLLGKKAEAKAKQEIEICEKYMDSFFLPTELAISENKKHLVHIQPKIVGKKLRKKDLQDEKVKKRFLEFLEKYNLMVKETGLEIDLLGRGGVLSHSLSNLFITSEKEIFLIDATILHFESWLGYLFHPIKKYALWRQAKVISLFLK